MKRYLLFISTFFIFSMCSCGVLNKLHPTGPTAPPQQNINEDVPSSISGTVYDSTMDDISLITDDGQVYSFKIEPSIIKTTKNGIQKGFPIVVEYYGKLDQSARIQNVKMKSINISDFDNLTPEEQVRKLLMVMSLEEKVGQMFIARCPENDAAEKAAQYHLGGYILFSNDFRNKTKSQVISDIESYQKYSSIGMFIGVDEEGGTVNRISIYPQFRSQPFSSPQELYNDGGFNRIISDTKEKCELLKSLGINMNFAPVCDVSTDENDFIYKRAFGKDASSTSQYIKTVVSTMSECGTGSVLKHFPGYGNNVDTHTGIAYDKRPYSTFKNSDFLPFQEGISAGAGTVLVCHNIVECMDKDLPASLSPEVHRILRDDLGFEGVIITDDLYMDAIKEYFPVDEAAIMAVEAGNDLLCSSDFEEQISAVCNAIKDGTISEDRINQSVSRILKLKIHLGII